MGSPISDLDVHHEAGAMHDVTTEAFNRLYWTPDRVTGFLNQRLMKSRQHIAKHGGQGSATLF